MRTLTVGFCLMLLVGVTGAARAETSSERDVRLMGLAIEQSRIGARTTGGGPIGAVVADTGGKVIGRGFSQIGKAHDPTAHAEIVAIRQAAKRIRSSNLKGATMYTTVEPCPMCLAACEWANIGRVCYAVSTARASRVGFPDGVMYKDLTRPAGARALPVKKIEPASGRARGVLAGFFRQAARRRVFRRLRGLGSISRLYRACRGGAR